MNAFKRARPVFVNAMCVGVVLLSLTGGLSAEERIVAVDRPKTSAKNDFYVANRPPLTPSPFLKLPIGSIKPQGWLRKQLQLEADGFVGHLTEIGRVLHRRREEIRDVNSPAVKEAQAEAGKRQQELEQRKRELREEFDKLPETVMRQAEYRKLEEEARKLDAERGGTVKAAEARCRAENKAFFDASEKTLAEARKTREQAEAEVRRLEESFRARPDVVKLKDDRQRAIQIARLKATDEEYLRWCNVRAKAGDDASRIENAVRERLRAALEHDPKINRLDREIASCRDRARLRRPNSAPYVAQRTVALTRQVRKVQMATGNAIKENIAKCKPEYDWLQTFQWLGFSGHYNYNYNYATYLRDKAAREVNVKVRARDEVVGTLESIRRMQAEARWHTRCEWEWRLRQEIDGSIERLPMMKKWLARARGPVKQAMSERKGNR